MVYCYPILQWDLPEVIGPDDTTDTVSDESASVGELEAVQDDPDTTLQLLATPSDRASAEPPQKRTRLTPLEDAEEDYSPYHDDSDDVDGSDSSANDSERDDIAKDVTKQLRAFLLKAAPQHRDTTPRSIFTDEVEGELAGMS